MFESKREIMNDNPLKFNKTKQVILSIACFVIVSSFVFIQGVQSANAGYYDYSDVVLIVNDNSATSTAIANYFEAARNIPASNVIHISTVTTEAVSRSEFKNNIETPIENFLISNNIASTTNYIVTTKGVPLKINNDPSLPALNNASVDQALMLILGKYSGYIGNSTMFYSKNPYFQKGEKFSSSKYGIYLVTRLTGYTIQQVKDLIDRSSNATTTNRTNVGTFVLDVDPSKDNNLGYKPMNDYMRTASKTLKARGYNVILDQTSTFLTNEKNVLGYYSWGSNDCCDLNHGIPGNTYVNGAIGGTAVSSSARSFTVGTVYGQSLSADLIKEGISGMSGSVNEPYVPGLMHPDVLFDRYTDGYNLADSYGMATPSLSWKEAVVGDPKMIIVPFLSFDISSPVDNIILTSPTPAFTWSVPTSYNGISKYQLYVDGVLAKDNITSNSTTLSSPLSVGSHTWYVRAVDTQNKIATSTSTYTLNVIPNYVQGNTFYVDNVLGNDNNAGSQTNPWKTVTKAAKTAQAGNTVIIMKNAGVPYRGNLTPLNSGNLTDGNIIFKGQSSSSKPEIWGSDDVSQSTVGGWTMHTGGATNTYQKSFATSTNVVAVGPSISNLTKKIKGNSINALNAGKWYWASGVLYYRLALGESISTLHIEAGDRNYGVGDAVSSKITYKNLIVKYANTFSKNPNLVFPIGDNIASPSSDFRWTDAKSFFNISKYQLYIDGSLTKDNILGTSTTPLSPLSVGSHTWYVKAINSSGNATTSIPVRTVDIVQGYKTSQIWYVDNVLGNDNNPGNKALPWKTLTKAAKTAQAGNTVIIIKNIGVPYRERLAPSFGGIIFKGVDTNSKPEIWGSDDVSQSTVGGWSVYSGGNSNTYQKSFATSTNVLATGLTISTLEKRVWKNSATTLGVGQWYWASGVLYYRLALGENISTLHIEASSRKFVLTCNFGDTFEDMIVKYANKNGVFLGSGCIGEGLEVYDSGVDGVEINSAGALTNSSTLRYSVIAGSYTTGVSLAFSKYVNIYNNIFYNNGIGMQLLLSGDGSNIRNNIFSNNTENIKFSYINTQLTNFTASNNNWSFGTVDSKWQNTYKGTNNQASTSPLFKNATNRNFKLKQLSPDIDTGTAISGLTIDILGNPIYGTPDVGAYEYQPPYTIGTNKINISGETRLYADGKYRYTTATSSTNTADLTIRPKGGWSSGDYAEYMNISISNWQKSGTYNKTWTEDSKIATTTAHTIGDLKANTYYTIKVDGSGYTAAKTNTNGKLAFDYSGGYTKHTFNIIKDITSPTAPAPANINSTSSSKPNLSWGTSSDLSGIAKYQLYIDGSLDKDNITTTSAVPTKGLSCGNHKWYVKAIDNAGYTIKSPSSSITMECGGGIFTGKASSLPGYVKPRMQIVYSDGTVVYLNKKKTLIDTNNIISKNLQKPISVKKISKTITKTNPASTTVMKNIETKIRELQKQIVVVLSDLVKELQKKLQNISKAV